MTSSNLCLLEEPQTFVCARADGWTPFSSSVSRDASMLNNVKRKEQFKLLCDCWAIKHRPHLMFQVRRGLIVKGLVLHKSASYFAFLKPDSPSLSISVSHSWENLFIKATPVTSTTLTQAARRRGRLLQSKLHRVLHLTLPKEERVQQRGTDFCVYIS